MALKHLGLAALALALTSCGGANGQEEDAPAQEAPRFVDPTPGAGNNSAIIREAMGAFEYRKISTGEVTGSETFTLTAHGDGSRTLIARNRTDRYDMQRHIVYRVDANFRPLSTYAQYYFMGKLTGTGLFVVDGNRMQALVQSASGIVTQDIAVPDTFSMIPHPISSDAWYGWQYDRAKGGEQAIRWYNIADVGRSGDPLLSEITEGTITYLGETSIDVPAGTFTVDHWRLGGIEYFTTGPDDIMVRLSWTERDNIYELTRLEMR